MIDLRSTIWGQALLNERPAQFIAMLEHERLLDPMRAARARLA